MPNTRVPIALRVLCAPLFCQIQNQPDDAQWPMAAKNYASTRFSTLNQINTTNVGSLKLAWSFSTGLTRGHEAAPLVVNNTMYIVTPFPNLLYALDLTRPGAPVKWSYDPHTRYVMWRELNFNWASDAYGTVLWTILFLHTFDVVADLLMTLVLLIIVAIGRHGPKQRLGVHVDSIVWYFLVAIWLPLYAVLIWGTRLIGGAG